MNESPPKKEAAPLRDAAPEENLTDADSLTDTQPACNSKSLPPGYGWEGESIVPTTLPPTEAVPLTQEQVLLRTIAHACQWSDGNPARWQAFLLCGGYDSSPISEAAELLRVTPRLLQMRVAECRAWLADLRRELESEGK